MKTILDYIPAYCPNCGGKLYLSGWLLNDFLEQVPVICPCGAELEYTPLTRQAIELQRRQDKIKFYTR